MQKIFIIYFVLLLLVVVIPRLANAQVAPYQTPSIWPFGYWGGANGLLSCTGNYANPNGGYGQGVNPCTSLCDLIFTAINIVYFLMSIAIFIVTPAFLVIGGIMIMLAGANPGMLEQGKKTITGTLIGLVIILCSYIIVAGVIYFLGIGSSIGGFGTVSACAPSS